MGCDINAYVETRSDGVWSYAGDDAFPGNDPAFGHCPFDGVRSYGTASKVTTVRDFLGDWYFGRLELLSTLGAPEDLRIVFWFDN